MYAPYGNVRKFGKKNEGKITNFTISFINQSLSFGQ